MMATAFICILKAVCSGTTRICLLLYIFHCKISLVNLYHQQMK